MVNYGSVLPGSRARLSPKSKANRLLPSRQCFVIAIQLVKSIPEEEVCVRKAVVVHQCLLVVRNGLYRIARLL